MVQKGRTKIGEFYFPDEDIITMGRAKTNDVVLPDQKRKVSRYHAALIRDYMGDYWIRDLGSLNLTRVGGEIVYRQPLDDNSIIQIGDFKITYRKTALEDYPYNVLDLVPEDRIAGKKEGPFEVSEDSTEYFTLWETPKDLLDKLPLKKREEIQDITRRIKAIPTFSRLIDELMDGVYRTLRPQRGLITLVEKNGRLQPYGIRGLDIRKRERITITPTMREHILKSGQTFQTPSTLCVPIKMGTNTIGFFYLDRKSSQETFSEEDVEILNFLSDYAAPYIQDSYRRKNNQEMVEDTRPFLKWKPTIVRHIEGKTGEAEEWVMMVGKGNKMTHVFKQIYQVADTDINVLLMGDTGTGKELVAKAIHERSSRSSYPFLTALCTAIPENMAETEFFGVIPNYPGFHHKEGQKGLFELADGGTVFLDEIGNMSRKIQEKILRVVEYKKMKRLGDERERTVEVRIIAATKEDLKKAISERRFREDLFFKFREIIHLPSLRDRKEDIPLLAHYFLDKYSEKYSARTKGISHGAMKLLLHYDWVGNVRQLEGVIENCVIKSKDKEVIFPWELPEEIQKIELEDRSKAPGDLKGIDRLIREELIKALRHAGGNVTQTARFLEVTRQTIINWIKKYDVDVKSFRKC